jgi:transposase
MNSQRLTAEFKQEAVRQVTERGYSVAEVADRMGVSTHSLNRPVFTNGSRPSHPIKQNNKQANC